MVAGTPDGGEAGPASRAEACGGAEASDAAEGAERLKWVAAPCCSPSGAPLRVAFCDVVPGQGNHESMDWHWDKA